MATADFKMMWEAFPDHEKYPTLLTLHTFIGGTLEKNIYSPGFGPTENTCAVRMSRALNYSKFDISAKLAKQLNIETLTGMDGKLYIYRVTELKKILGECTRCYPNHRQKRFCCRVCRKKGNCLN